MKSFFLPLFLLFRGKSSVLQQMYEHKREEGKRGGVWAAEPNLLGTALYGAAAPHPQPFPVPTPDLDPPEWSPSLEESRPISTFMEAAMALFGTLAIWRALEVCMNVNNTL